jgi:hypothetical protein
MIKARKGCKAEHGDMVISQPSAAVREAMESLGLDRLFSIYEDDEDAIAALNQSGQVEMESSEESAVMIHMPGESRPLVARLMRLDSDSIDCRLTKPSDKLVQGRELGLKFRLPLYRKEFFELKARIETIETTDGVTVVSMRLTQVSDEDRTAIESFVDDMGELRKAARGG